MAKSGSHLELKLQILLEHSDVHVQPLRIRFHQHRRGLQRHTERGRWLQVQSRMRIPAEHHLTHPLFMFQRQQNLNPLRSRKLSGTAGEQ